MGRMSGVIKGLCKATIILAITGTFNHSYSQQQAKPPVPIDWNEVDQWKRKVEAHPDSLGFHTAFIKSFGWSGNLFVLERDYKSRYDSAEAMLDKQYKIWISQFPKVFAVHYAVGSAYWDHESPKATPYLKRAAELDPKNADAFFKLSIDAERWGDNNAGIEYMRLASEADPSNPAYFFYYANSFRSTDLDFYHTKVNELVRRFPEHERGAQGLYWLGNDTKGAENKIKVYEELRLKYPPEKFSWSESGMYGLFEQYLYTNQYEKAISLSESLILKRGWSEMNEFAKKYSAIQSDIHAAKYKEAYDSVMRLKISRLPYFADKVVLLEAVLAEKTGHPESGYQKLLQAYAKTPTPELDEYIATFAKKTGKDETSVKRDIWGIRAKTTKPAYPFDLGLYTSEKNAKLSDYKGKVILLTFWFPGCGPCRAEFPHFENVVKKYSPEQLVYLGINVLPNQDDYVLPFMRGTKYSFIPLKATSEWAAKHYGVKGEPTNFLLDQEGNIVFANFRIGQNNETTLELMINSLLEKH
ncbi:MAG: redoxin domain-containing protein [Chitinophagaceae bacterium]